MENGTVEVEFVKSEYNLADVFTKNVREMLNERLTDQYMDKRGSNYENTK